MLLNLMKSLLLMCTSQQMRCEEKHRFKVSCGCFLCLESMILKCADISKLQVYFSGELVNQIKTLAHSG